MENATDDLSFRYRMPVIYIWDERILYMGKLPSDTKYYSSSVFLFGLSLHGDVAVHIKGNTPIRCSSFFIPPNTLHQVIYPQNTDIVWMQIEPAHRDCIRLQKKMTKEMAGIYINIENEIQVRQGFFSLYRQKLSQQAAYQQHIHILGLSEDRGDSCTVRDMRILDVMLKINSELQKNILMEELADSVGLSSGRVQQLFKQQVQMSIRQYRLWKRLKYASEISFKRENFLAAAIDSGFSDAAHFSRAFHQQFGKPASKMLGRASGTLLIGV